MQIIDGAAGEGGGQILRSSLALSLLTQQPFKVTRIRARRRRPGLLRQHLTAVKAAAAVGGAQVTGAHLKSDALEFHPGPIKGGNYHFSVGTAGSATLVMQTVLPALLRASEPSELVLEGGTHNGMSPPFDFIERVFLPCIRKMGAQVEVELKQAGFYPAGGGRFIARITPSPELTPLQLIRTGGEPEMSARVLLCKLPEPIARRQLNAVREALQLPQERLQVQELRRGAGPGNVLMIEARCPNLTELFTGFGRKGLPAEKVAHQALDETRAWLACGAPVGEHLADQLLLPMAMAGGGRLRTSPLSQHTLTNMSVIRSFMQVPMRVDELEGGQVELRVGSLA